MEDQQQPVEDDGCVSSCTLIDILQAAPGLAELLPPQGCKALAASCTSIRTWQRARVTVIRLTDPKDMALLQPRHWPRLMTVMYDNNNQHPGSGVARMDVERHLPATWTQHASVYLRSKFCDDGEVPMCHSLPINTIAVLVEPAGLQMLQQQDKRAHMGTLKNLMKQAAPYATDMVIAGDLGAPIVKIIAQHRWLCLTYVTLFGPSLIDAGVVSHLGQFVPQSTHAFQCAHCHFTPEACSSLSDKHWPGLRILDLSDCSLDAAAVHCLSKAVWSNLNILNLSQNLLDCSAVKHLVSARLLSLTFLLLRGTGLNAAAFESLSAGNWPRLSWLLLQDNHIDIQGIQLLMQGAWPRLQHLGLTHNMLDEGVYAVLEVRCWQQQCAGLVASDVKSPYRRSCAQAQDIAMSRSTGTTWPRLDKVTISFGTTYTDV